MNCNGYTKVWDLASGELVRLDGARGTTLRVTRGVLWITLENDLRDVILTPGDTFTIDREGLSLIEAQDATTVCVLAHHVDEWRLRDGRIGWMARFAEWLESIGDPPIDRGWAPYY